MNSHSPNNPLESTWAHNRVDQLSESAQMDFIRKTYVLLMVGILTAIVAGCITLNVAPVTAMALGILGTPILAFALILGGAWVAQTVAEKPGLDVPALLAFTSFLGFLFAPIIALYAPSAVGQAAVLTIVIFSTLTAYVFISRKDFSFMGGLLCVGAISMVVGLLLNAFWLKSSMIWYFMSWGILFLSSGFVLYDTSSLVHRYRSTQAGAAALGLFVSIFNMFLSLLNILGGSRD